MDVASCGRTIAVISYSPTISFSCTEIRMTNQDRRREKLKNAVLFFDQQDKTVGLTKLMKLLYFVDFELYRDYGQSLTGQSY